MPKGNPKIPESDFMRMFDELGAAKLARKLGLTDRAVYNRRSRLEFKHKAALTSPNGRQRFAENFEHYPERVDSKIENGICLVGSDCHYWPGKPSLMHRAFVKFCKDLSPTEVILNGDIIDGASISRFPASGWDKVPTVQEEIEVAQERLHEIAQAVGKARKRITRGNHDARYERRLVAVAPEFVKVHGVNLSDHFPLWTVSVTVWINADTVVKHRFKGGMYAARNSTLYGGKNIILGDGHRQIVHPFSDYNGIRYGVDAGCIADINHQAFRYCEGNAKDWREGFCVLSWKGGKMLGPELVSRWDENSVQWRGQVVRV